MSFKLHQAFIGFQLKESSPSYDYRFRTYVDITAELKNKFIKIDCTKTLFGDDIYNSIPKFKITGLINYLKTVKATEPNYQEQNKLMIDMVDDEGDEVVVHRFVFILNAGWVIRDQNANKIDASTDPNNVVILSDKGYRTISSGKTSAEMAKNIAILFNLSPAQTTVLVKMAESGAVNASDLYGKAADLIKDEAPFGIASDTMEHDYGKEFGQQTQRLQRCLIRFAGGNLESERKGLRGENYPVSTERWKQGYGPIIGRKADNGKFGDETKKAILELMPYINQIRKGFISDDGEIVKDNILTSPICQGLIGDITIEEKQNSKSKTKMPISSVSNRPIPVIADPTPPVSTPAPTPQPTNPPVDKTKVSISPVANFQYKTLSSYKDILQLIFDESKTRFARTENLNNRLTELNTKVDNWLKRANAKNINIINEEIKQYSLDLENEYTVGVTSKFNTKAIEFLYILKPKINDLLKTTKESKVYKDYNFLSTKNEKLYSVLMEQLKKDLKKRG